AGDQRQPGQVVDREQAGAQSVVEIVVAVRDVVGERGDLRLGARVGPQLEIVLGVVLGDVTRYGAGQRTIVLDHAFERFPGQVYTVEPGVAALAAQYHL